MRRTAIILAAVGSLAACAAGGGGALDTSALDAPLLFVKRQPYMAGHIYDDYYTWRPGGGIYVVENPADPPGAHRVRAVIDANTPETLGAGVYRDPDISWDARRVLFAFKGEAGGETSIYEIGLTGRGLRRLTFPARDCTAEMPVRHVGRGRHDITPCYLPDGRIAFTSTRQGARVPCFNSEVDTLHVMNADGSGIHAISVNNVNEFDPAVLPDGRILYGRWEYVDKTALYMQSLWTVLPDGTHETALFANNLARPTALLDARPVPGTHLVVAALTPHNGQAVGAIAMIDPTSSKNGLSAVTNFTPGYPTKMDQGLRRGPSDPWPLSRDLVLIANNAEGDGVIELIHRDGRRRLIHAAEGISCYSPMLVKPRPRPPVLGRSAEASASTAPPGATGRFFVQDVYEGLEGVRRGEVRRLRVIEETARVSGIPPGGRWWNQAFLVSWQGAYVVKNILGTVPVAPDGSAHFQAPAGRALYFQALDADGRAVQSMRTFVQAAPGATRSCIGCHEDKLTAPPARPSATALARRADRPRPESWGSGFVDYPTMVQPILDAHCLRCHGGREGIAAGLDLSGGWTWGFSLSYETLLKNTLVGFLNCHNAAVSTSRVLPPRTHGSGGAPLAELLLAGHEGRIEKLTDAQRDLLLAWMDTNANYYGTWNWTPRATCEAYLTAAGELSAVMAEAGCSRCHRGPVGDDWINLRRPEASRILRAPLKPQPGGWGLGWCRDRKARKRPGPVTQRRQPPDVFRPKRLAAPDPEGPPVTPFESPADPHYRRMLASIRRARSEALARPRVDMPGAEIIPGRVRRMVPCPLPAEPPAVTARVTDAAGVRLAWPRSAEAIGLAFEVHRGPAGGFEPSPETLLATTTRFAHDDPLPPVGPCHYAVVGVSAGRRGPVGRASVAVPEPTPPAAPANVTASGEPGQIALRWQAPPAGRGVRYVVARREGRRFVPLTDEPIAGCAHVDPADPGDGERAYRVRAVDRRGTLGEPSPVVRAAALRLRREPTFAAFAGGGGKGVKLHGRAAVADGGVLDLARGGHAAFAHRPAFDVGLRLSVACRVRFDRLAKMPVVLSCGHYGDRGWFLQAFGGRWRWHVGGVSCDGGRVRSGRWVRLVATFDGRRARLYQDGRKVADVPCPADRRPRPGALIVGQYSAPAAHYQVLGRVADVRLYRRAIPPDEAATMTAPPSESD